MCWYYLFNKWFTGDTKSINSDDNIGNISILEYPTLKNFRDG